MKKYPLITIIVILSTLIVVTALHIFYRTYQQRHFSCTTYFQSKQRKENLSVGAIFRFIFIGNKGIVTFSGEVIDSSGIHHALNRQMLFTFSKLGNVYLLVSQRRISQSNDEANDDLMRKVIPPFYFLENKTIQYTIERQKNGDYIITNGKTQISYCRQ